MTVRRATAGWMLMVAWVAGNAAAARALWDAWGSLLIVGGPAALAAEVALWRAARRPRARAFWLGGALGLLAALTMLAWSRTQRPIGMAPTGTVLLAPAPPTAAPWEWYMGEVLGRLVFPRLERPIGWLFASAPRPLEVGLFYGLEASLGCLPIVGAGLVGGGLAWGAERAARLARAFLGRGRSGGMGAAAVS